MITLLRASYQDELRVPIFTGLSTDGYPHGEDIINGTEFHCIDTGVNYRYDIENESWYKIPSEGGSGTSSWMGDNPVKIYEYSAEYNLSDTDFVVGTVPSSTSEVTIRSTQTIETIQLPEEFWYSDIIFKVSVIAEPTFAGVTSLKAMPIRYFDSTIFTSVIDSYLSGNATSMGTYESFSSSSNNQSYGGLYFNAGGFKIVYASTRYGVWGETASTISCSVVKTNRIVTGRTMTVKSPAIKIRKHSSYFSDFNIQHMTDCVWKYNVEIWAVDHISSLYGKILQQRHETFAPWYPTEAMTLELDNIEAMSFEEEIFEEEIEEEINDN